MGATGVLRAVVIRRLLRCRSPRPACAGSARCALTTRSSVHPRHLVAPGSRLLPFPFPFPAPIPPQRDAPSHLQVLLEPPEHRERGARAPATPPPPAPPSAPPRRTLASRRQRVRVVVVAARVRRPGSSPSASAFSASHPPPPLRRRRASCSRAPWSRTRRARRTRGAWSPSIASCAGCRTCRTASTARRRRGPCGPCGRPRAWRARRRRPRGGARTGTGGCAPSRRDGRVPSFKAKSQQSARCHSSQFERDSLRLPPFP